MVNRTAAHWAAVFCVFGAFFEALFSEKQVVPLSVKFRKFFFSQINCKRSVNAFLAHFPLYRGGSDNPENTEILRNINFADLPLRCGNSRYGSVPAIFHRWKLRKLRNSFGVLPARPWKNRPPPPRRGRGVFCRESRENAEIKSTT